MFEPLIKKACLQLKIDLKTQQIVALCQYADLIKTWNSTYNLVSAKTLPDIATRHIIDSLTLVPYLKNSNLLDIGSGAGLPSIVLAIAMADLSVTALDSVGKKCRFMRFCQHSLNLNNLAIEHSRVENFNKQKFEQITCRAFANTEKVIQLSKHLLAPNGVYWLMKGVQMDKQTIQAKSYQNHPLPKVGGEKHAHLLSIKL